MWDCEEFVKEYEKKLEERNKQAAIEYNKKVMLEIEEIEKQKAEQENNYGISIDKYVEEKRVQGEIVDEFVEKHLEARIATARWALALAMAMTLLFKGFWALWIIFIAIYIYKVKCYKSEALEADLSKNERGVTNEWLDRKK